MMAYANNFVASILINNKPQREFQKDGDRTCYIPFDTEYQIRLKNKNSLRCKVQVDIDGMSATGNSAIVLDSYGTLDLERFIIDKDKGRKFKFLSQEKAMETGEINDPDSPDNGYVTLKFYQETPSILIRSSSANDHFTTDKKIFRSNSLPSSVMNSTSLDSGISCSNTSSLVDSSVNCSLTSCMDSIVTDVEPSGNEGVTGEGSISTQKFQDVADFVTVSNPVIIKIKLLAPADVRESLLGVYVNKSTSPLHHVKNLKEGMDWVSKSIPNATSIEIR
jgi:hypothetical protein